MNRRLAVRFPRVLAPGVVERGKVNRLCVGRQMVPDGVGQVVGCDVGHDFYGVTAPWLVVVVISAEARHV